MKRTGLLLSVETADICHVLTQGRLAGLVFWVLIYCLLQTCVSQALTRAFQINLFWGLRSSYTAQLCGIHNAVDSSLLNTTTNTKRPTIARVQPIKYPVAAWGWVTTGFIAVTCSYLQRHTNVSVFWEVLCAAMCSVVPGTSLHWLSTTSISKSPAHLTKGQQPLFSPRNLKKWQFSVFGKFIVSPVCAL